MLILDCPINTDKVYSTGRACALPASSEPHVPWKAITNAPYKYVSEDMLPNGAVLKDPYRMPHEELSPLWDEVVRRHRLPDQCEPWHFSHVFVAGSVVEAKYGQEPEAPVPRKGAGGMRDRRRARLDQRAREDARWAGTGSHGELDEEEPAGPSSKNSKRSKNTVGPLGSSSNKGPERKRKATTTGGRKRRRPKREPTPEYTSDDPSGGSYVEVDSSPSPE